jgi:hypothetical protein
MVLLVSVPLVAAVMGFRSQHRARADRKGAWRIAIALFLFVVAWGCLAGDRPWPRDQNDVWHILAVAFFIGGTAGGLYFGLEPHIRRLWPSAMVGWTRLLGGRLLDPLVGRNILAGIIGGVTISIFQQLAGGAGLLAGEPTMRIFWGSLDFAWRDHLALASLLVSFTIPILMGFTYLLLLVFLRHVTNRMWLAAAIFVAIYPFLELWNGAAQPWRLLVALPTAGVILLLCMRAGMLAVQACLVCNMALVSVPMVSDLGAWYARGTIVILVFVGLLTAGAAAAAAYGRASFARASSPGGD